jgi:hypothetical protein
MWNVLSLSVLRAEFFCRLCEAFLKTFFLGLDMKPATNLTSEIPLVSVCGQELGLYHPASRLLALVSIAEMIQGREWKSKTSHVGQRRF